LQPQAATSRPATDGTPLSEGLTASSVAAEDVAASPLGSAVLALAGLGLLVGIAGGLRALQGRRRYP
jgi:hypothetical protein